MPLPLVGFFVTYCRRYDDIFVMLRYIMLLMPYAIRFFRRCLIYASRFRMLPPPDFRLILMPLLYSSHRFC